MENPVLNIISRVDANTLPVVPRVLLDLIHATHQNDVSFKELSRIIGQDAGLSSKVLATANSSYYRQWGEITDLNRVITVLGLNTIKTIAITRTVQQFFSEISQIHHDFLEIIWYRSLTCAYLGRRLAKLTGYEFPDEAYLTGLIHRIGQLVLLKCFPKEYPYFLSEYCDLDGLQPEKETFGASHEEIGSYLITTWNIPSRIPDAILYQSHPAKTVADSPSLIKIINLATQLARADKKDRHKTFALAGTLFGLNQPLLEELLDDVESLVDQSASSLGIVIANPQSSNIRNLTPKSQRNAVQASVADFVKKISLASAIRPQLEPPDDAAHLVAGLQRDCAVLFGLQVAGFYSYCRETDTLAGALADREHDIPAPAVPVGMDADQSLLAKSFLAKQMMYSFDNTDFVAECDFDRRLRQSLGKEGLLSIPLQKNGKPIGVVVAGINRSEVAGIESQADFINLFAKEAAQLSAYPDNSPDLAGQTADDFRERYQLRARKLAHEANNPLGIINNYLYLLRQKLGEERSDEIRIIQEEIDRVSNIILRLPDEMECGAGEEKNLVDVNSVIIDLINLFRPGIFKTFNIETVLKLDEALPEIATSRSKLKQILTNLIKNSAEAMPTGGTLTLSTQDQIKFKGDDCIEIQVRDTGPGLPQDVVSRLFSPVTSTKGNGHSGLGLTICKNLVDELKGAIQCGSSSGHGTTLRIILPRKTW